jgi:glutaredoxin
MSLKMFSKKGCPYCLKARQLLKQYNIKYSEIELDPNSNNYTQQRNKLFSFSNQYTFPIIYNGEKLIGGYSELSSQLF